MSRRVCLQLYESLLRQSEINVLRHEGIAKRSRLGRNVQHACGGRVKEWHRRGLGSNKKRLVTIIEDEAVGLVFHHDGGGNVSCRRDEQRRFAEELEKNSPDLGR